MTTPSMALEFLFTDTDVFPTEEEYKSLENLKQNGYISYTNKNDIDKNLISLSEKGMIGIFKNNCMIFFYIKEDYFNRPITIEFYSYYIKIGKTADGEIKIVSQEEKAKAIQCREFIAKWIFNKKGITNTEHIDFLKLFINRIPYTLTVPAFVYSLLEIDIKKTPIEYRVLTPIYNTVHCPYCRHKALVRDENNILNCPECSQEIIIR